MEVCMLLDGTYPPDARVRKEAKSLVQAGHEVRIVCPGEKAEQERLDGVTVRRFQFETPLPPDGVVEAYHLLRGLYPEWQQHIERECENGVDIFHVHDLVLAQTALETIADHPIVLDLHENYPAAVQQYRKSTPLGETLTDSMELAQRVFRSQAHWNRRLRDGLRAADHVLAVVPEARQEYINSGAAAESVTVVSNTVDLQWFDRKRETFTVPSREGFVLTYVGTLSGEHRGVETAIHALGLLRQSVPDATLRLVGGRSDHKERLKALAADRGLADAVEFTGWVTEETIPSQIAAADVGIVPHRSTRHTETTVPHKLFQYMAAGIPVLATNTDPVARIVGDADAGPVVPAENPEAMATAARRLTDATERQRFGANGRAAVEDRYNWERDAARLQGVYSQFERVRTR